MSKLKEAIILKVIMPIADWKFKTRISKSYLQLSRMAAWSPEKIKVWQNEHLCKRIQHAYDHIPYYHKLFDSLGIKPEEIREMKDLKKIPVLTKDIIRKHYKELMPDDLNRYSFHNGATGGSTGTPVRYLCDNISWSMANAFCILRRQKTGYHYGDKFIGLGGSSIGTASTHSFVHRLYYRLIGKCAMASKGISGNEMKRYHDFIKKNDIRFIYGYSSVIYLFAKYVVDNNLQDDFNIQAVFPTSDMLTPYYAEVINKAWNCKILDSYGAFDSSICAYRELWNDQGFLTGYNIFVETDNAMGPSKGNVLVTDLVGYSFPFIRYDLGDVVELDTEKSYSSNHNGQVLKSLLGRSSDLIKLGNGFYITEVSLHNAFKDIHIDGYRVEVEDDLLTISVVPNAGYTDYEENEMKEIIMQRTGGDYRISVIRCDKLEYRANGKSLFVMTDGN